MNGLTPSEETQLLQTIEMFEVITQSQPSDYQSLEILKEAYSKLGRAKETINTAKRIASAYMQLGQLSSAILEYETILQQHPDDPDVRKALADIENKAVSMAAPMPEAEIVQKAAAPAKGVPGAKGAIAIEDGREVLYKLFVDGKHISAGDFDLCWSSPNPTGSPGKVIDPFLQVLQDKNLLPLDKSLKVLCDKSGIGYMPLERYDVDLDLAKKFPKDVCQRWCVVPFDHMSKSVMVATANPFNKQAAKEISEATKDRLIWYISPPPDLIKVIKKVFR
jgi:tetratricopeptide (TPR) repeat protein